MKPWLDEDPEEEEDQAANTLTCECQFCHNNVFIEELDQHEQACE